MAHQWRPARNRGIPDPELLLRPSDGGAGVQPDSLRRRRPGWLRIDRGRVHRGHADRPVPDLVRLLLAVADPARSRLSALHRHRPPATTGAARQPLTVRRDLVAFVAA